MKALEISCNFLPSEFPLFNHILLSYSKYHVTLQCRKLMKTRSKRVWYLSSSPFVELKTPNISAWSENSMISRWISPKYRSVYYQSVLITDCYPNFPIKQVLYQFKQSLRSRSPNLSWLNRVPLSRAIFCRNLKNKSQRHKNHRRRFLLKLMPTEMWTLINTRKT